MRVVYSFSVPDSSIAHWQLKKWKSAGVNISGHLLKLIEGEGSQVLHLEKQLAQLADVVGRQGTILEALGTSVDMWKLSDRGPNGYMVHGVTLHSKHAAHIIKQAEHMAEYHTSIIEEAQTSGEEE